MGRRERKPVAEEGVRIQVLDEAEEGSARRSLAFIAPCRSDSLFGVYYQVEDAVICIYAVLDLRRNPAWIRRRLITGER